MTPSPLFTIVLQICLAAMFATAFMCLYRLIIGPGAADRAIALDMITNVFVGIICLLCMLWGNTWYFDAVWVLTIVGFISSAAVARYLEKGRVF